MSQLLTVGIGDIHGRFHRVQAWIEQLEHGLGRPVDVVLSVGDVEAFRDGFEHLRKGAKRQLPAEFTPYATGELNFRRPFIFIGGNNEDFETLHPMAAGGELIAGVRYLGRSGVTALGELRVAFLSGIYAPRHFETELREPRTRELAKHAGYFRRPEVESLQRCRDVDLMLVHEWPKGLVSRTGAPVRAQRFPWIGNPVTRKLVGSLRPRWLWCGHSHVPLASSVVHPDQSVTRVACLDQAVLPDASVFWLLWEGRRPVQGGWGVTGQVAWREGAPWTQEQTPAAPDADPEAFPHAES